MSNWQAYLFVFIGGGLGSVLRWLISKFAQPFYPNGIIATLGANMIASLLLGYLLYSNFQNVSASLIRFFLIIGFCGGLSTFSTFSAENLAFLLDGQWLKLGGYILLSVFACLLSVWLGMCLAKLA
ncbi:MAG: CrcB family protein [Saprospiraceae bacterium]|nr:CrcB family protein [Saprospiraceae bacterium]